MKVMVSLTAALVMLGLNVRSGPTLMSWLAAMDAETRLRRRVDLKDIVVDKVLL